MKADILDVCLSGRYFQKPQLRLRTVLAINPPVTVLFCHNDQEIFFYFLTQWSWATIFSAVHTDVHGKIKWDGNSTVVAADTFKVAEAHTWRTTKTLNKMFFFVTPTTSMLGTHFECNAPAQPRFPEYLIPPCKRQRGVQEGGNGTKGAAGRA